MGQACFLTFAGGHPGSWGRRASTDARGDPPDGKAQERESQGQEDRALDALKQPEAICRLVEIDQTQPVFLQATAEISRHSLDEIAVTQVDGIELTDGVA